MYANYRNSETEEIIEYKKPYGEDFPAFIMRKGKDGKKRKFERWFNTVPVVDVAEGLHGNAKNGYSSTGSTYHPSKFSPMKSVYGSYGRTAGVESE